MKKGSGSKFIPTAEMLKATEELYVAIAFEKIATNRVLKYQKKILLENKWEVADEFKDEKKGPILYPSLTYLMSDEDSKSYFSQCNEARIKAGLKIEEEGQCPMLVAQEIVRERKRTLMMCMEPITGITQNHVLSMERGELNGFVELTLNLLTQFLNPSLTKSLPIKM